jgi:acyl-coenzyme A synthetase/AMP-(fatty) acid ligase
MNCLDVIFFQAELTPEKLAIVAQGSVVSYGRLAHGIVSAQQRLAAAGLREGHTVALHIAHPIDQLILICALYRLRVASASINDAQDPGLDAVKFDALLVDKFNPLLSRKQPTANIFPVETSWFRDEVTFSVAERTRSVRDPNPDWVCRITCVAGDTSQPTIVRTTARALEAQLTSYCVAALPDWERMISVIGLHTLPGLLFGLTALWLGRTVCVADVAVARNLIVAYKHHLLVASAHEIETLLTLQATDYTALSALRGAFVTGQGCAPGTAARCLETISSNTVVSYVDPAIGIVAYAAAGRVKDVAGAAGFVAPWADVDVLGADGAPAGAGEEGELRFRDRGDQTGVRPASADRDDTSWTYPGQRARRLPNNLLVIGGGAEVR